MPPIPPFDVVRLATDPTGSAWLVDALCYMDLGGLHYIRDCILPHIKRYAKDNHASHVLVALIQRIPNDICGKLPMVCLSQHKTGSVVVQWTLYLADDAYVQTALDAMRSCFLDLAVRRNARGVLIMMAYRVDLSPLVDRHLSQIIVDRNGALLIRDLVVAGAPGVFECILRQPVETLIDWCNNKNAFVVVQASLQECNIGSLMVHKLAPHQHCLVSESGRRVKHALFATASPCAMRLLETTRSQTWNAPKKSKKRIY